MATLTAKSSAEAVDVSFGADELIVTLSDARRIAVPLDWFPRLRAAPPSKRRNWRLIGRGIGIHWPELDEDISVKRLLAD